MMHKKPRLVYFQYKYDRKLPSFLLLHKDEHARCLAYFFDVRIIDEDCDYSRVCDEYEPAICLFESGVPFATCRRPKITNVRTVSHTPKVGLLNADGFGEGRTGFLSDMDEWGIETFFAIATTAGAFTPSISANLYLWPNSIDPLVYRDYSQSKTIPVLITGSAGTLYPWRQQVFDVVRKHYPCLSSPHPGYSPISERAITRLMVGESYARTINSSWVVPACGSVVKEILRKHFEVPACRACLVTEQSLVLEAAGFIDMVNCVFATPSDIIEKLDYLFSNPVKLESIINHGFDLVHSRHSNAQRDQIYQWFALQQKLKPNQSIVQDGPFMPLRLVDTPVAESLAYRPSSTPMVELLSQADEMLSVGRYSDANSLYARCAAYYPYMPEPQLKTALCCLFMGESERAEYWIRNLLNFSLADYNAARPDPIEWACFILLGLCQGKVDQAVASASEFAEIAHPVLDRARSLAFFFGNSVGPSSQDSGGSEIGRSIHQMTVLQDGEWLMEIKTMLRACRQHELATRIAAYDPKICADQKGTAAARYQRYGRRLMGWWWGSRKRTVLTLRHRKLLDRMRARSRRLIRVSVHFMERRLGLWIPYRFSAKKDNSLLRRLELVAAQPTTRSAIILGANTTVDKTAAVLTGLSVNPSNPSAYLLTLRPKANGLIAKLLGFVRTNDQWIGLGGPIRKNLTSELGDLIRQVKAKNGIKSFSMAVVDASELGDNGALGNVVSVLSGCDYFVLDDIHLRENQYIYRALMDDASYWPVEQSCNGSESYAIFERRRG